ncbi:MAG: hypothetical protein ACI8RD_007266, partial [Bacillariaceae sp.]
SRKTKFAICLRIVYYIVYVVMYVNKRKDR